MRTNGKHNIDRKPLSTEEINRKQDFNAVLAGASGGGAKGGQGNGGFNSWLYIAGSSILIIGAILTWTLLPSNKEEAIQRQVEQNIPETMPRTQEDSEDIVRAPLVRLPVKEWDMAYSSHTLDAKKGGIISLESGTIIRIPGSCVVDENNQAVNGKVEYRFREFIDPIDIALSGIPMHYDSAGTSYYFETAGMTELRAFQGGKELKMAAGKKVEITLKNEVKGAYNLYQLDEENGWLPKGSTQSKKENTTVQEPVVDNGKIEERPAPTFITPINDGVTAIKSEISKLENEKPKAPQKATISRPTFNLEVDFKDFPELASFEKMLFEVAPEDKVFTQELYKVDWNNIELKRHSASRYKMILTKVASKGSPRQEIELIVIPVIAEEDFAKAQKQYASLIADYEQKLAAKKAEEKRLIMEAQEAQKKAEIAYEEMQKRLVEQRKTVEKISRTFSVDGFGIWNCDNPKIRANKNIACRFTDTKKEPLPIIAAYCIMPKSKGLLFLGNSAANYTVPVRDGSNSVLLLVLEGNQIAVKNTSDLNPIEGIQILVPVPKEFTNATEIKNYIYQTMR